MEPRLALNTWWWWHWCQFDYYLCYARACKILLSSSWKAMETTFLFSARGVLAMHYKSSSMSALFWKEDNLPWLVFPALTIQKLHLPTTKSWIYSFLAAVAHCTDYPFNSPSNLVLLISRCYTVSHVLLMTLRLPLSFLWSAAVSWKLLRSWEKKILENLLDNVEFIKIFALNTFDHRINL